jgi:hypothetical protein
MEEYFSENRVEAGNIKMMLSPDLWCCVDADAACTMCINSR